MVSAVVINWNGLHYLEECLDALLAQDPPPSEVILADNHSDDGSREFVAERFPAVEVVDTGGNLGPGAARNAGVAAASGDLVLVLDNDVILQPGALAALRAVIDEDPEIAMVQARSVCHDRPDVVHYDAADLHYLGLLLLDNFFRPRATATRRDEPVGAAVSLCCLCRRDAFRSVGGYHEELFFYFEDTDLAWRLRLAGHRLRLAADAVVLHRGGTPDLSMRDSSAVPAKRTYYHSRNRWAVLLTCLRWRSLLVLAPAQLVYTTMHFAFALMHRQGLVWWRGKFGLLRMLPTIWRWRREAQRSRMVADRDLLTARPLSLNPGVGDRGLMATVRRGLDRFYVGYWRVVRGLCG